MKYLTRKKEMRNVLLGRLSLENVGGNVLKTGKWAKASLAVNTGVAHAQSL